MSTMLLAGIAAVVFALWFGVARTAIYCINVAAAWPLVTVALALLSGAPATSLLLEGGCIAALLMISTVTNDDE